MGLGLWKLGWPGSQVAGIFPGILLLRGLGLAPGLDFFGLGCRWTSGIMDALIYEYTLASGREFGIWRASARNQGFLNFPLGVFKSSSWVGLGLYFHVFNLVGLGLHLYDIVLSLQYAWKGLKKIKLAQHELTSIGLN